MKNHVESLSDDELIARTTDLVSRSRRLEAELVAHLAEVDARKLYLRKACPSMFVYVTSRLGLSEAEAYLRITAARVSRRFPAVLERLAAGRIQLSAIARLAPHLTDRSAERLLARAEGRSKREVELLVAELAPRPDTPALVRRLPAPASPTALVPGRVDPVETSGSTVPAAAPTPTVPRTRPPALVPLAPARFKVQFTASSELEEKLARARALLRHQIPDGDLAAIVDRALTTLIADLERRKCAATAAPRRSVAESVTTPSSRRIPAAVRRAVWQRDGARCTFVDATGRRCPATDQLEFHHEVPFARGGDHSLANVRLLCRGHNGHRAELDFGAAFMRDRIAIGRPAEAGESPS